MAFQSGVSKTYTKFHVLEWKIENFSFMANKPEMIKSQVWCFETEEVGGCGPLKWKLCLKKHKEEDRDFYPCLSLLTQNYPQAADVADLFVRISMESGPKTRAELSTKIPDNFKTSNVLNNEVMFRFPINQDTYKPFLDQNGALVLNLRMELSVVMKGDVMPNKSVEEFNAESETKVTRTLVAAFRNGDVSCNDDAMLVSLDKKEIKVKWAVLAAQSPVFAKMYESKMSERASGIIEMKEMSGKALEVFHHFISTGTLLPAWKDDEVIVELVNAAAMYEFKDLLEFLDEILATVCNDSTVMKLLSLCQKLSMSRAAKGLWEWVKKKDSPEEYLKLLEPMSTSDQNFSDSDDD